MFIERSRLFHGLDPEFVAAVEAAMIEVPFGEGAYVFRSGESAERLYILEAGRVRLVVGEFGVVSRTVRSPGDVFGWSSLLGPSTYTATARCLTEVRLMSIGGAEMNVLLDASPAVGMEFFRRVAGVIRARLTDSYRILMSYEPEKRPQSYG